jgi:hypothetical protein
MLQVRDLAGRTLEAYRELNTVAAEAAYRDNGKASSESLARASELLEGVLSVIRRTDSTTSV